MSGFIPNDCATDNNTKLRSTGIYIDEPDSSNRSSK